MLLSLTALHLLGNDVVRLLTMSATGKQPNTFWQYLMSYIIFFNLLVLLQLHSLDFTTQRQGHRRLDLCCTADDELFNIIVTNSHHILHTLLPPSSNASQHYTLRRRTHSLQLPGHPTHLSDCNFILRILYKNCYRH